MLRKVLLGLAAVVLAFGIVLLYRFTTLAHESHEMTPVLSDPARGLAPCPDKPNCVSSSAEPGSGHWIESFSYSGDSETALRELMSLLDRMENVEVIQKRDDYIHAEAETPLFGFVDDIEFLIGEERGRIEVRSASRVGHSDLGANAERVERIRGKFENGGR